MARFFRLTGSYDFQYALHMRSTMVSPSRSCDRLGDDNMTESKNNFHAVCCLLLLVHANTAFWRQGWEKGALYRIWCGVNRLGDSGVKVV